MDAQGVLGYVQLTEMVNELNMAGYQEAPLTNRVPGRSVNGRYTEYRVRKPRIPITQLFQGPGGSAVEMDRGDLSVRGHEIPFRFVCKRFDQSELDGLVPLDGGEQPDNGVSLVDLEVKDMDLTVRQGTNEWLVAQALQGPFNIKLGNSVSSITVNIDYGIPASHRYTVDTLWTTVTANIKEQLRSAKEKIRKKGGMPTQMLMNDYTANLIHTNTTLQNYFKERANVNQAIIEDDELPRISGLQPVVLSHRYADEGQLDSFEKAYIPDGKVIILPAWPTGPGGWIEMQRGKFSIPTPDHRDMQSMQGVAVWKGLVSDSPTGYPIFEKVLEFPVVREPWNICVLTVA
jgi:hypothetical protein